MGEEKLDCSSYPPVGEELTSFSGSRSYVVLNDGARHYIAKHVQVLDRFSHQEIKFLSAGILASDLPPRNEHRRKGWIHLPQLSR